MNKIELCLSIAVNAHRGQIDKNGNPYILHPLAVGLMGATDEEKMVGFLHDVVEDTDYTFEDLENAGVPTGVVNTLRILTHCKDSSAAPQNDSGLPQDDGSATHDDGSGVILSDSEVSPRKATIEKILHSVQNDMPSDSEVSPRKAAILADYEKYIGQIIASGNPVAMHVKLNDLTHNLNRPNSNEWFARKYLPAIEKMKAAIADISKVTLYQKPTGTETAFFACGCFWGVQHQFSHQKGVLRSFVGYTGGEEQYPEYDAVRAQKTGHAEAVAVEYDPAQTDFKTLCRFFFEIHNPAQTDGQGPDIGSQYRSCIFYNTPEQKSVSEEVMEDLRSRGYEVNTTLVPATDFWIAEEYHQNYYEKTGGEPYCHLREKKF